MEVNDKKRKKKEDQNNKMIEINQKRIVKIMLTRKNDQKIKINRIEKTEKKIKKINDNNQMKRNIHSLFSLYASKRTIPSERERLKKSYAGYVKICNNIYYIYYYIYICRRQEKTRKLSVTKRGRQKRRKKNYLYTFMH